jgi:hypothetical protein
MDDSLNEMMAGNAVGQSGGFSSKSDAAGPVAGYDKKLKKPTILARGLMPGARKRWSMKEETVDEQVRLKSWDEFSQGAAAAGDRINRHVVKPASKAIRGLKNLITPPSPSKTTKPSNDGRRATGGLRGVGTKADNNGAVKIKVEPFKYKSGDKTDTDARSEAEKLGSQKPGDVYIKRSPGDGLPKVRLDKKGLPIPNQYGVQ